MSEVQRSIYFQSRDYMVTPEWPGAHLTTLFNDGTLRVLREGDCERWDVAVPNLTFALQRRLFDAVYAALPDMAAASAAARRLIEEDAA